MKKKYELTRETKNYKDITEEDIWVCWGDTVAIYVLQELLTGEKSVEEAREDLLSLIGSKWDIRTHKE